MLDASVRAGDDHIRLLVIYRPPYSSKHKYTASQFLSEFSSLLESIILSSGRLIITGDFNIHLDNTECNDAIQFKDLISSCGLVQHVNVPTHD